VLLIFLLILSIENVLFSILYDVLQPVISCVSYFTSYPSQRHNRYLNPPLTRSKRRSTQHLSRSRQRHKSDVPVEINTSIKTEEINVITTRRISKQETIKSISNRRVKGKQLDDFLEISNINPSLLNRLTRETKQEIDDYSENKKISIIVMK